MPGFNGLDALRIVRERNADVPFIFVSGTIDEPTAVAALRQGAQDYLIKGRLERFLPAVEREIRESADRQDRKRLEQQVLGLQKFEAIGRLAGGIAHDFNNILGAILGWAEMGLDDPLAGARARERFQKIIDQAHRATKLTSQILAFARRQVLQPRSLNLNAAVDDLTSLLHKLIGDRVEIRVLPEPVLRIVKADPAQMEQVLMNLCLNARDAMPEGGLLIIETRNVDIEEEHLRMHPEARPGPYVLLSVSDTGVGMDQATIARIFEPFFTTKEMGRGTGLGLATVYGIVKQHGGFIYVYSEPGKGTAFRLYFPGCEGRADAANANDAPLGLRKGSETVLLADDHEGLRQSAHEMLQELGYQVMPACNGREAVNLFSRNADRIHLVILDVMMPEMDGPHAYQEIIGLRANVPVIFSSGYAPDAVPFIAAIGKGTPVLQKPYTVRSLSQAIRAALDGQPAAPAVGPGAAPVLLEEK
jgi:signal transduction histidine kinase